VFRFLALIWNSRSAEPNAAAQAWSQALASRGFRAAPQTAPCLKVFVSGAREAGNGVHALAQGGGLLVGRAFLREHPFPELIEGQPLPAEPSDALAAAEALCRALWGRYVAFLPTAAGEVGVLRDPTGALPCHHLHQAGVDLVFSWLEDVLALPGLPARPPLDWDHLARFALQGGEPGDRATALAGVRQLLPGELLTLGGAAPARHLAWNGAIFARQLLDEPPRQAQDRLRQTTRACVQAWARGEPAILLRLSGGLDSAILLSCLDRAHTAAEVVCLNHHSVGASSDERPYARLAAAKADRPLVELERQADFALEALLRAPRTPTPSPYLGSLSAAGDAEVAACHGARVMFTGGGGDQLFYEFRQWWPAADALRQLGPGRRFLGCAMDAARLGGISVWLALLRACQERLRPSGPQTSATAQAPPLATSEALQAMQAQRRMARPTHPALQQAKHIPIGKLTQLHHLLAPAGYYDALAPWDRPELVNPLLSQPLVELCLQLPSHVLTTGGRSRGLARRAFADDIPRAIAWRRSKGGMQEHAKAVLAHNLGFARELLLDGELVRRRLLDRAKVEEVLSGRPTPLAAHVGELHMHIAIEAWLQRWRS
jgi:asparagine synthase (glutamine-hydrolysing)